MTSTHRKKKNINAKNWFTERKKNCIYEQKKIFLFIIPSMFFEEQKGGKWEKREQSFNNFRFGFFLCCININIKMSMGRRKKMQKYF